MELEFDQAELRLGSFALCANFRVPSAARVAVLGPSGGGKSTLLAAIAGFQPLASGALRIGGQDMAQVSPAARPVTLLFQDNNLFPHLSAAQNIGLGLRPDLRLGGEDWAEVDAALERVGLAGLGPRKPAELSGGQASRVALARALLRKRPLLLLDEPFAALGPALKAEMLELVTEIATGLGATLIMVTHAPQDAQAIGGETVVVADGVAHPPKETEGLLAAPGAALGRYLGTRDP